MEDTLRPPRPPNTQAHQIKPLCSSVEPGKAGNHEIGFKVQEPIFTRFSLLASLRTGSRASKSPRGTPAGPLRPRSVLGGMKVDKFHNSYI